MKTAMTLSVLLLSVASATPSLANYFHNPYMGLNLGIGSAANPTPRDLRENRMPQLGHAAPPTASANAKTLTADTKPPQKVASK